jgi:predicted Kef-type K+ transport protein
LPSKHKALSSNPSTAIIIIIIIIIIIKTTVYLQVQRLFKYCKRIAVKCMKYILKYK